MKVKKEFLDKHYRISKELIDRVQREKPQQLKCEVDCIEYFLEKGLMYDKNFTELNNKNEYILKRIIYVEKLLEQLFSNISFSENNDTKTNELLKDFKNKLHKEKYFE